MYKVFSLFAFILLITACQPGWESDKPPIHLNPNMDSQERYNYQSESKFFKDGRTVRQPVEGTISRKYNDYKELVSYTKAFDSQFENGKTKNGNLVRNIPERAKKSFKDKFAMIAKGKEQYNIYCAPCHNYTGDGKGILNTIGGVQGIANLHNYKKGTEGLIYKAIKYGVNNDNMPSYATQIQTKDRWAIIAYIYELQKQSL